MLLKELLKSHIAGRQAAIDRKNRARLTNDAPTLICSNCLGGYLYHWLGLRFDSPFINLWMKDADFIRMLQDFDAFLDAPLLESSDPEVDYPVGEENGIKIYFMHYATFAEAKEAWERRKQRIHRDNLGVILSSASVSQESLRAFDALPFAHKIAFSDSPSPYASTVYLKRYKRYKKTLARIFPKKIPNVFLTRSLLTGKRVIDDYDYVSFINSLRES